MKKVVLSIIVASSLMMAADTKQDCVENFQNEIFNILNEDKPKDDKQKALDAINKNMLEACDTLPEKKPMKHKEAEDCIENFENDVMKIILSEPESDKQKGQIGEVYKSYKEKCDGKF